MMGIKLTKSRLSTLKTNTNSNSLSIINNKVPASAKVTVTADDEHANPCASLQENEPADTVNIVSNGDIVLTEGNDVDQSNVPTERLLPCTKYNWKTCSPTFNDYLSTDSYESIYRSDTDMVITKKTLNLSLQEITDMPKETNIDYRDDWRHTIDLGTGYNHQLQSKHVNKVKVNTGNKLTVKPFSNEESASKCLSRNRATAKWPCHSSESLFLPSYQLNFTKAEQFEIGECIGSGSFSQVYKVIDKESSKYFALKKFEKSRVVTQRMWKQVQDEVEVMLKVGQHKFILGLISCWQTKGYLYQVLPYVFNGDLYNVWKENQQFPLACVSHAAAQIAIALEYVHDKGVIYRDLKMENILLSQSGHVLLSDFGLSKVMGTRRRTYTICGTLRYMAPEVASGNGYSYECDWWSFGILIVAMVTGKFPFKSMSNHEKMYQEIKEHVTELAKISENVIVKEVVKKLLSYRPWLRLSSLQEIKKLQLFADLSFEDMETQSIAILGYMLLLQTSNERVSLLLLYNCDQVEIPSKIHEDSLQKEIDVFYC